MIVAIFSAKLSVGFIGTDGSAGYELDLALAGNFFILCTCKGSSFFLYTQNFLVKRNTSLASLFL